MKKKVVVTSILFLLIILSIPSFLYSAEEEEAISAENIKKAVERAIKDVEAEKDAKQKEELGELKASLYSFIKDQFTRLKDAKTPELNKLTHQNWATLNKFTSPVPYDYYLRNFNYTVTKSDIVKTDSLVSPYRGIVEITEKMFVERYHSSNAVDIKEYQDTITTPLTINLEYRDNKFMITSSEFGEVSIRRGW